MLERGSPFVAGSTVIRVGETSIGSTAYAVLPLWGERIVATVPSNPSRSG